jgi:hypothetical protein
VVVEVVEVVEVNENGSVYIQVKQESVRSTPSEFFWTWLLEQCEAQRTILAPARSSRRCKVIPLMLFILSREITQPQ